MNLYRLKMFPIKNRLLRTVALKYFFSVDLCLVCIDIKDTCTINGQYALMNLNNKLHSQKHKCYRKKQRFWLHIRNMAITAFFLLLDTDSYNGEFSCHNLSI